MRPPARSEAKHAQGKIWWSGENGERCEIFLSVLTIPYLLTNYDDRSTLTAAERIAYTNAVLCFQNKSAQTPTSLVPGARSRFDDFVGTHINQTLNIHYTVSILVFPLNPVHSLQLHSVGFN